MSLGRRLLLTRYAVQRHRHLRSRLADVALLHHGRCGSTVVSKLLGSVDGLTWDGEVFERMRAGRLPEVILSTRPLDILRILMSKAWRSQIYGIEVKAFPEAHLRPTLANSTISLFVRNLRDIGFTHIVVLTRRNLLNRAISIERGRQDGNWHRSTAVTGCERLMLCPERVSFGDVQIPIVESFRRLEAYRDDTMNAVTSVGLPLLSLSYEDDIDQDPRCACNRILEFVGSDAVISAPPDLKRTNPRAPREKLANPDAIERTLADTDYAWMME